ncbi:MAG: FAD-binding protein [Verrucomicrobia subdivision 3 bacterium]|nr:FAD-binding protein [Limisphaerales bacterium]
MPTTLTTDDEECSTSHCAAFPMNRRRFLRGTAALPVLSILAGCKTTAPKRIFRARPGSPDWPSAADWDQLSRAVGGRLIKIDSPLVACQKDSAGSACAELFARLKNPFYIGGHPALTQTSGWVDAWTSRPSVFAVNAANSRDVVAAVNFARQHNLRLVIKGGGHSYQGTSNSAGSLLVWTRAMNAIAVHDDFVPRNCSGKVPPQPAVTVGAGAIWLHTYDAVTTRGGRYVQGGGCTTVGVAGLIQSGGFGSFSKRYGMAAAALLEAEIITADGVVRVANPRIHPDLFWGIKGGGGGSLGVVTKLTLRTRELPDYFGAVFATIKAHSGSAFRKLTAHVLGFYRDYLFNPHWGEQIIFDRGNTLHVSMVFQGLDRHKATDLWQPFFNWVKDSPQDFSLEPPTIIDVPGRQFWNADYIATHYPTAIVSDDRPGARANDFLWQGDHGQVGWVIHGYRSTWLPASLLKTDQLPRLADALFASRHARVSLHFNKGLAGAPAEEIDAARDTATNPAVLDAFALAIIAGGGPPAFPGIAGREPNVAAARQRRREIHTAMDELLKVVSAPGSYVSESDFFENGWQQSFWGANYPRLAAIKNKYDPEGLFFVHHGVGSEHWSPDGFTQLSRSRKSLAKDFAG